MFGCGSTAKRDDYAKPVLNSYRVAPEHVLSLQFMGSGACDFRVKYDSNNTIGSSNIMYQGGAGFGGFLAQIAAHAAANSAMQESKLAKNQEIANLALNPLQEVLKHIHYDDLIPSSNSFSFVFNAESNGDILYSKPLFFFSKDLKTLTLKHIVKIDSDSSVEKPKYQNMVEVINYVKDVDPADHWKQKEGLHLISAVKDLYLKSLQIIRSELNGKLLSSSQHQQKNFRINLNNKLRVERGSEILQICGYKVIRNLRGWIIAYPDADKSCQQMGT